MLKEIYKVCPICKKLNTCYKIGTQVFCKKGKEVSERLENIFNKKLAQRPQ